MYNFSNKAKRNCNNNTHTHTHTHTHTYIYIRLTSVIPTYQLRLNSKLYVPSTTFGSAMLGANGAANKIFSHSCAATPMSVSSSSRMWG